jgi:hypothetical protein
MHQIAHCHGSGMALPTRLDHRPARNQTMGPKGNLREVAQFDGDGDRIRSDSTPPTDSPPEAD